MKLYIAGPMTGVVDHNFPLFFDVSKKLRAKGHEVSNPAENDASCHPQCSIDIAAKEGKPWLHYMRLDIKRVADVEGVVMLPGWRESKGATIEYNLARSLGYPVFRFDEETEDIAPLFELIGLSGYARSGKDTVGKMLVDWGWERLAFADAVRDFLYQVNPILHGVTALQKYVDKVGWENAKTNSVEVRDLLQRLGTEAGRNVIGPNIWVDATMRKMRDGGRYVFTDCRFPNEAKTIKGYGGSVIRLVRPDTAPVNAHVSETALDSWYFDATISNSGTLGDLQESVAVTLDTLGYIKYTDVDASLV